MNMVRTTCMQQTPHSRVNFRINAVSWFQTCQSWAPVMFVSAKKKWTNKCWVCPWNVNHAQCFRAKMISNVVFAVAYADRTYILRNMLLMFERLAFWYQKKNIQNVRRCKHVCTFRCPTWSDSSRPPHGQRLGVQVGCLEALANLMGCLRARAKGMKWTGWPYFTTTK